MTNDNKYYPIMDSDGRVFNAPVYTDTLGNAYATDKNNNTYLVNRQSLDTNPVQLGEISVFGDNSPQKSQNTQRQALMRAAGYNVPNNGNWDESQDNIWNGLTTRPKEYDTTFKGLIQGMTDLYHNDTYEQVDPFKSAEVKAYNPDEISLQETARMNSPFLRTLNDTYIPLLSAYGPSLLGKVKQGIQVLRNTPIGTTLGGLGAGLLSSYVGSKAVDESLKALIGKDWSYNAQKYLGLDPYIAAFVNPGGFIGIKPAYYGAKWGTNAEKRLYETAMRSSSGVVDPTGVWGYAKEVVKNDPKRAAAIAGYILSGKTTKATKDMGKGYYAALLPDHKIYYDGTTRQINNTSMNDQRVANKNDMIDAFLYEKEIDPAYGLKRIEGGDYGIHADYVTQKYPNKKIPVYEQQDYGSELYAKKSKEWEPFGKSIGSENQEDFFSLKNPHRGIDVGGHLTQYYKGKEQNYIFPDEYDNIYGKQHQDIWKFNPDEYMTKWVDTNINPSKIKRALMYRGLKDLDLLGTPVITRTPLEHVPEDEIKEVFTK